MSRRIARATIALGALFVGSALAPATAALSPTAMRTEPDAECVLSDPHPVASSYGGAPATGISASTGESVSTSDGDYDVRAQLLTFTNTSRQALSDIRFVITGFTIDAASAITAPTSWNGADGQFETATDVPWPSPEWAPRDARTAGAAATMASTGQTPALGWIPAAGSGIPLSGVSSTGTTVSFTDADALLAYDFGSLAVGAMGSQVIAMRVERPVSEDYHYAVNYAMAFAARTCLPTPTMNPWETSLPGTTAITGTGDYPGDVIDVLDGAGTVVATTTVNDDLTWSVNPDPALVAGIAHLNAVETDEFNLTGTTEAIAFQVAEPAIALKITDAAGTVAPDEERAADLISAGSTTKVTFAVRNDGAGDLHDIHLTVTPSHATISQMECDQGILTSPSGVTLPAGQTLRCTGTVAGLPTDGSPGSVRAAVVARTNDGATEVTAESAYWALGARERRSAAGDGTPFDIRDLMPAVIAVAILSGLGFVVMVAGARRRPRTPSRPQPPLFPES